MSLDQKIALSRAYNRWLDRLVEEKGLDREHVFTVEGASGANWIPLSVVLSTIKVAPRHEQAAIKAKIVQLDFANAPLLPFFGHLARALAV